MSISNMLFINFATQVKCTIKLKKHKLTDFGKSGELSMQGIKSRFYLMSPPTVHKYLEIHSIYVEWVPTVPHLLEGEKISLKIKDMRSANGPKGANEIVFIRKSASSGWQATIPCSLFVPISEASEGLPIGFDFDLPAVGIKAGKEMGKIKINVGVSGTSCADAFCLGPIDFRYNEKADREGEVLLWKGMKHTETEGSHESATTLAVSKYLDGRISLSELGVILAGKMLIG